MEKDKLLQFLSDAIDKGAKIEILFYGEGESRETAEKRTNEFSEIVGSKKIEEVSDYGSRFNRWFKTETANQFRLSHFYENEYMEEDVDFSGMGGEDHATT